ncbi:hypothetical protein NIES4074_31260 [Cylindrospermum sp. NIES-4074]|nr:hypothetical protein NIES4074_31260 [Cylindrospermum sp. NIES-4074]
MKTTPVIKPLLMASASTVLGLAIVGVLGDVLAQAAEFRVYGKFAPKAAITENDPGVYETDGFFEGIISSSNGWSVTLFSSQGRPTYYPTYSFNSQFPGNSISFSNFSDRSSINFIYDYLALRPGGGPSRYKGSLNLFLDQPNFSGKITSESYFYKFEQPYYVPSEYAPAYTINVVDGYVEKVPEPSTIVGLSLASVMGWWMKRRKKALQGV